MSAAARLRKKGRKDENRFVDAKNLTARLPDEPEFPLPKKEEVGLPRKKEEKPKISTGKIRNKISEIPCTDITGTIIGLVSEDYIKKVGIEINKSDTITDKEHRLESHGTLNDPLLGVSEVTDICGTCGQNEFECPANHIGYINLRYSLFHPLMMRRAVALLNSICWDCAGLYLTETEFREKGLNRVNPRYRLSQIEALSEDRKCIRGKKTPPGCHIKLDQCRVKKRKFKMKDTPMDIIFYDGDYSVTIDEVKQRFECISKEDLELLGFREDEHPRNWILKYLPVISPAMRPSSVVDGEVHADHITEIYRNIICCNNKLRTLASGGEVKVSMKKRKDEKDCCPETQIDDLKKAMFRYIKTLFLGDEGKKLPYGLGNFISIKQRMQGKNGMLRNNMMGKRGGWAGRSVITPDPTLPFGKIRIPENMAKVITKGEVVTERNKDRLTALLRSGKVNYVEYVDGNRNINKPINEQNRDEWNLVESHKVHRYLQDGDYVVANRQPTLHKEGMMGFEAVISSEKTIGLHMSVVSAFNADFDGDEMNIYVPQGADATLDVAVRMNVKQCIMSAQSNRPIIGLVYDAITGSRELTKPDTMLDVEDYYDALSYITAVDNLVDLNERLQRYGVPPLSGKALFSALLPSTFFYQKGTVIIREGVLIQGMIVKEHIGTSHNSIIQVMWRDHGYKVTSDFITDANLVINRFFQTTGFSVGLDDCLPDGKSLKEEVSAVIDKSFSQFSVLSFKVPFNIIEISIQNEIESFMLDRSSLVTVLLNTEREQLPEKLAEAITYNTQVPADLIEDVVREALENNNYFDEEIKTLNDINTLRQNTISTIGDIDGEMMEIRYDQAIRNAVDTLGTLIEVDDYFRSVSQQLRSNVEAIKDKDFRVNVNRIIDRGLVEVDALGSRFNDPVKEERRESEIKAITQKIRGKIEDLTLEHVSEYNNFRAMAASGAKGDKFNMGQIVGILGQQAIKGERMKKTISDNTRCLPYFPAGEDDVYASGFCRNGYTNGLEPGEYFYAAASGRIGLLDLATKTAETGAMHHKIVKSLEDVRVYEDGTVRNGATDRIIQFAYGNDGFNANRLVNVSSQRGTVANFIDWKHEIDRQSTNAGFLV